MVALAPEVRARRLAEERDAKSISEIHALYAKWAGEDQAARAGESAQSRELAALRQRVVALERELRLNHVPSVQMIRELTPKLIDTMRRVVGDEIEKRSVLTYGGTWDEGRAYDKGALITDKGSLWVARAGSASAGRTIATTTSPSS